MSFTSHAFHIIKEIQPLSAAIVAFAAAGVTVFVQRRIAEKQGQHMLAVAQKNIDAQALKESQDRAVRRLACSIEVYTSLGHIIPAVDALRTTAEVIVKRFEANDSLSASSLAPLIYARSKNLASLPVFDPPNPDIKLFDPQHIEFYYDIVARLSLIDILLEMPKTLHSQGVSIPKYPYEAIAKACSETVSPLRGTETKFQLYSKRLADELQRP